MKGLPYKIRIPSAVLKRQEDRQSATDDKDRSFQWDPSTLHPTSSDFGLFFCTLGEGLKVRVPLFEINFRLIVDGCRSHQTFGPVRTPENKNPPCLAGKKDFLFTRTNPSFSAGRSNERRRESPLCLRLVTAKQIPVSFPGSVAGMARTGCSPFSFAPRRFRRFALSKEETTQLSPAIKYQPTSGRSADAGLS